MPRKLIYEVTIFNRGASVTDWPDDKTRCYHVYRHRRDDYRVVRSSDGEVLARFETPEAAEQCAKELSLSRRV